MDFIGEELLIILKNSYLITNNRNNFFANERKTGNLLTVERMSKNNYEGR